MNKRSDAELHRVLKNWINRQRPPENGRARLLWEAAHVARNKVDLSVLLFRPQYKSYPLSSTTDWAQTLFAWVNENSLQIRYQARLS